MNKAHYKLIRTIIDFDDEWEGDIVAEIIVPPEVWADLVAQARTAQEEEECRDPK